MIRCILFVLCQIESMGLFELDRERVFQISPRTDLLLSPKFGPHSRYAFCTIEHGYPDHVFANREV